MRLDRRVKRTRRMLSDALMTLILEKGYDAVTVQDITERANLGRATFYLHYRDKGELLLSSLKEIFDELVKAVAPTLDSLEPDGGLYGKIAFENAAKNRDLYRVMLSGQGTAKLIGKLRDYFAEVTQQRIHALQAQLAASGGQLSIPIDILSQYIGGSLLSLITWWLESDNHYPPEYMAETFHRLVADAIRMALRPPAKVEITSA